VGAPVPAPAPTHAELADAIQKAAGRQVAAIKISQDRQECDCARSDCARSDCARSDCARSDCARSDCARSDRWQRSWNLRTVVRRVSPDAGRVYLSGTVAERV